MLLKLFVVLSAVGLVKSSAIDFNIFKDEKTKEVSLTTCDANACDAICKRFGYKDGVCSDGQCMCFYYARRAKYHTEEVRSQNNCYDLACSLICSAVGFIGGLCIEDDCQCYDTNHIKLLTKLKPKASFSLADSCNSQACDQLCRKLGFPGGACVGDSCDCDNFKPQQEHHNEEGSSESYCDELTCYVTCIISGSIGGTCAGDSCYCYTSKPLKSISHLELKPKASFSLADSCISQVCDQLCRELGLPGGACDGDSCECNNFKPLEEFLSLIVPKKSIEHENSGKHHNVIKDHIKKTIPCDVEACNDFCHRSNYIGGVCIGNSCNCY